MNFKDEYKKEMQDISPTDEQTERIRNGVMKRLAQNSDIPENASPAPQKGKKKKPLYLKIAAVSGTAVCAAAIAIFVIVGSRGGITNSSNMTGTANNGGTNFTDNTNNVDIFDSLPSSSPETSISDIIDNEYNGNTSKGGSSRPSSENSGANIDNEYTSHSDKGNSDGSFSNANTSDPNSTDNGTSGAADGDEPTTGGNGETVGEGFDLYLQFSEDKSYFKTVIDDETHYFSLTDGTREFSSEKSEYVGSNFGDQLIIQREGRYIAVFRGDGSFVGVFEMTY